MLALAGLGAATPASAADDGATVFKRCAACHLGDGAGVPGAFPPLKANAQSLAATAPGRRYLALAVIRGSGLDPSKVNPLGGAIALGHPLGATGAVRTATIVHGMRRRRQKYGMVTMCVGTGMGAAGIFEAL